MAVPTALGSAIGKSINDYLGQKAREAAEKLSDEDLARIGECFTVRLPFIRVFMGVFLFLLFALFASGLSQSTLDQIVGQYRSAKTIWDAVWLPLLLIAVFMPWFLFSAWALLKSIFWKIQVNGEWIVSTSFIGKKTGFSFEDITRVKTFDKQTGKSIKVYVGEKRMFVADPVCTNFYILLYRLKSEGVPFED